MTREILVHPDYRLRIKAKPVSILNSTIPALIEEMREIMVSHNGMGLAAPQIDVSLEVAVFNYKPFYMINPIIIKVSGELVLHPESCLSVPGRSGEVERPDKVKVRYWEYDGTIREGVFKGYEAFCIQHEIDHFRGCLYLDKIKENSDELGSD